MNASTRACAIRAAITLSLLTGAACRARAAEPAGPRDVTGLKVPAGFHISVFSSAVPGARSMTLGDKGTLFVGTQEGAV